MLSTFRQPLSSLWKSLVPLLCWLKTALRLPGTERRQQQHVRKEPDETREEEKEDILLPTTPTSVSYHFTCPCNYKRGFCFHTAKTSFVLPLEDDQRGLLLLKEAGKYLDILAFSCDSFDQQISVLIGHGQGKKNRVENLQKLRTWCRDYRVAFKINSVINRFNVDEDMNGQIKVLNPVRWKVKDSYLMNICTF